MSADNGTYVLQTKKDGGLPDELEYRISQCHSIEYLFEEDKGSKYAYDVFKDSPPVTDMMQAMNIAYAVENTNETEHGVLVVTHFRGMTFSEIKKAAEDGNSESQ